MQTTVEEADKHKVKLTVEIPPDQLERDLDRTYRKIAQQVRVPGFRKGKVPRRIIDAQIGRDAVIGEFLEDTVPDYYREAVREHELAPIGDPDISLEQVEEGKALVFTATVEVRPRLKLDESDYEGIEVRRPATEVSDREVDELLDRLRERFAELEPVSHPARRGDYVVVDLRASVHDEEVPEATRPDYLYEVGSGEFVGKLDEELEGRRAGEILKFNANLGERFGERAGQEVSFQVLVKEVKGKRLPAADDEFAKTASEFDTLAELRESLRWQLRANKERQADADVRDAVLQELVNALDLELPDTLVDEETDHRVSHARERAERAGLTLEDLLEAQGLDELRFRSEARAHAIRGIKADLILEAVARQENMRVSAEELDAEVSSLAAALGRDQKELAKMLKRSGQVVALAGDIIRSKALDFLVEHAEIVSVGESRAADEVFDETEQPSATPEQDPAEAES
ncbi:MAG: trigger factor [Actinomycetota bacterium]